MSNGDSPPRFDTRTIGVGEDPREQAERDVVSPIHLATTYVHDDMAYSENGYHYTRSGNPTRTALEERLSSLENSTDALATAAGMGAIGTVAMTLLEPGDHVVAFNYLYGGTRQLFDNLYAPSFGVDVEYVDATSTAAVAVTEKTKLIWVERYSCRRSSGMLHETVLFDALHSELAAVLDDCREIDSDRVATIILENDCNEMLTIGVAEDRSAVLTYNRLTNSISKTSIESDRLNGNRTSHIDRRRTEGQVLEAIQGLGPEVFAWIHPRYRWVFEPEYHPD